MNYTTKVDIIAAINPKAIIFHDIEDALIGFLHRCNMGPIALYDYNKALECLAAGMSDPDDPEFDAQEAALEWMHYNTLGAWVGDETPAFIELFNYEEEGCDQQVKGGDSSKRIATAIMAIPEDSGE